MIEISLQENYKLLTDFTDEFYWWKNLWL